MKKRKRKLTADMMLLTSVPLLILGFILLIVTSAVIYRGLRNEVESSLKIMVLGLKQRYEILYPGDYEVRSNLLFKGSHNLSGNEQEVDKIKEITGMDVTFFYENRRFLTSIRNEDGTRAVGTTVDAGVQEKVLEQGNIYFSDHVSVNGMSYFGYYEPLYNSDSARIGMLFAGESRETVMAEVTRNVLVVCIAECIIMLLGITVTSFYSRKAVYALEQTEKFLGDIAGGDLTAEIDSCLLERQDEIGEMVRFSVMLQQSITGLVGRDPLTGLPNRRSCDVVLDSLMKKASQKAFVFSIVMGDLDFFKRVNDTYGHQAGDEVLKAISRLIAEHMEHVGFVFRWGGEEFLLVCEDMDRSAAAKYLESLRESIEHASVTWNGKRLGVTITFGVSDSLQEDTIEKMIRHADANLYIGKEEGKNRIISS